MQFDIPRPDRAIRALALTLTLAALAPSPRAQAAGFDGPSYAGAAGFPSGSKSQSKLWWNDGSWWASLWSEGARSFTIHRLDAATEDLADHAISWIHTQKALMPNKPSSPAAACAPGR